MCGRNHNLSLSYDDLFGTVEDKHAISIMWIRRMCDPFSEKKKNITVKL